jgi:putative membrane protein
MLATGFLGNAYLWVKAAHVIFVIFWMAGMFMLPRFFIYHQATAPGSAEDRLWIEREWRLRSIILTPAMSLVWLFGLMLGFHLDLWHEPWFLAKFLFVLLFSGYHGWMIRYGKKMAKGHRARSDVALRWMNEIPGIVTAVVVILVIVRPF